MKKVPRKAYDWQVWITCPSLNTHFVQKKIRSTGGPVSALYRWQQNRLPTGLWRRWFLWSALLPRRKRFQHCGNGQLHALCKHSSLSTCCILHVLFCFRAHLHNIEGHLAHAQTGRAGELTFPGVIFSQWGKVLVDKCPRMSFGGTLRGILHSSLNCLCPKDRIFPLTHRIQYIQIGLSYCIF